MTRVETIKHVEGVRARWLGAHADPTINPAWANAERDIGLLLQDYDALAAEMARCRAANVYDGAAHKRVADLEAALRQLHHNARHALGGNAVRDRKIIEDAACERPSAPAYAKPVPDGHCPKCGERLIDGHHAPDLIPPFL